MARAWVPRQEIFAQRLERKPHALVGAALVSLMVHGIGGFVLSQIHVEKPVPDRVLRVAFVSQGRDDGVQEPAEPVEPTPPTQPTPPSPKAQPQPPRPAAVTPSPAVAPVPSPVPPEVQFPALYAAAQIRPDGPVDVLAPTDFETWEQRRTEKAIPEHLRHKGGGSIDGAAAIDSEGVDRCEPAAGRVVKRLYLLYDSSGSMSAQLRNQALSCAQQYARAVIDSGGEVVVGNFARSASFQPATRNPTDVAFALRADNDSRATILPSNALNPFFDEAPGARSDLIILSDGYIPNYRAVLPWYRYYLESNRGNRAYLYTLGTQAPAEVTAALRKVGFEIRVYRTL